VRLLVIAIGGWWLAVSQMPAWSVFALTGAALGADGIATVLSVVGKTLTYVLAVRHRFYSVSTCSECVDAPSSKEPTTSPMSPTWRDCIDSNVDANRFSFRDMSTGPCIIFDKSSLQSLSKAEANWLEHLFRGVLTPTLLIEVIADLKKAAKAGRTPEAEVTNLSEKIGSLGTTQMLTTLNSSLATFSGTQSRCAVYRQSAAAAWAKDGRQGMVFDEPPEMQAVRRWKVSDFQGMEFALTEQWRRAVSAIDLGVIHRTMNWTKGRRPAVKTLADVLAWVDAFIDNDGARAHVLKIAMQLLPVPTQFHRPITDRWKHVDRPMLRNFAGYAHHVLRVELFLLQTSSAVSDPQIGSTFPISTICRFAVSSHRVTASPAHGAVAHR
jgi:hypothetical protein